MVCVVVLTAVMMTAWAGWLVWPGGRTCVCDRLNGGEGGLYVWSGWWALSHCIPSRGMYPVTLVFVSVLVFVGPRWRAQLGGGIRCGAAIVAVVSVAKHGGRWWGIGCRVAILTGVWPFWFRQWLWLPWRAGL
jgi:hypothetical protein